MISPKKLIKIARKWQRLAAIKRKRISFPRSDTDKRISSNMADKGHFVAYTADQRRFMFPKSYLNNHIFRELLAMSEEQFGLSVDEPITLPCDAEFIEYVVSLIKKRVDREMQNALLMSIAGDRCSQISCDHQQESHHLLVCSF